MSTSIIRFHGFLALLLLAGLTGCGGGGEVPVEGEVVFGSVKQDEGDKWVIAIADGADKSYSVDCDASGKFRFEKVAPGKYTIKVTHYAAATGAGASAKSFKGGPAGPRSSPPPMPETKNHPDTWTVPGGPFKLDLSKLPASKKQ